jgi:hypothetical protein
MPVKLKKPGYFLTALIAAVILPLWVFQAGLVEYILKRRGGEILKVERVEGGLESGFRLYGVRVKTAAFSAYIRQAVIRPDLRGLLRGKIYASELIITGAVINPSQTQAGPAAKKSSPNLPSGLEIKTIRIEGGRLELSSEARAQNAVTGIAGELCLKNGKLTARSLRGKFRGVTIALSGEYGRKGLTASGDAVSEHQDMLIHFDYTLAADRHVLRAAGNLKDAVLRFNASLDPNSGWKLEMNSSGLPGSLMRADLPDLAAAVSLKASGRYFTAGKMTASSQFRAILPRGAVLEGGLKIVPDTVRLDAALSSPEAEGSFRGEYAAGALKGEWELNSTKALSFFADKTLYIDALRAKGEISGRASAPVISWSVFVSSAVYGPARVNMAMTRGEFRAGPKPGFKILAEIKSIFSGKRALGSARFKAEGTPAANTLDVALSSAFLKADLAGTSSFRDGIWKGVWTSFLLSDAPAWRLCGPFSTTLTKTRYQLSGFCASDGKAIAALTIHASSGAIENLDLALTDLSLESLEAFRVMPLAPAGLVSARALYVKGSKDGTMDLSILGLRVRNIDLGSVRMNGGFNRKRLDIRRADWKMSDGILSAAGTVGLSAREPDVHFVVTASTLNVAPLLVFSPAVKAEKIFLNGAAEIELKGSALTNRGVIRLESPLVEVMPLGLKLTEIRVSARGEESLEATITASAKTKGGNVMARGKMGASGPEIVINADKLSFSVPMGFSGTANGGLDFLGPWDQPSLSGAIEFPECRFDMEQWRKSPPPGPRNRFYESLTMDIKVKSERNAWYRDTPNSIEAKGDLILKKTPYNPLIVIGAVEALKGFYTYLGNTFTVESGTLVFGGEIPPNPKIAVSAANAPRESPIKIYLNATGTFRNPKIELSADPEMEQRDIMSYLLTGKPLYEFSGKTGGRPSQTGVNDSQIAAANIVANYLSQKTAGTLVRKLDIDVLNLRVTSERAADITVGRYLTPKFFISYGQVLSPGGEKRVVAEYTITPWWSLEGRNSSQGNYIVDLLFKFGIRSR